MQPSGAPGVSGLDKLCRVCLRSRHQVATVICPSGGIGPSSWGQRTRGAYEVGLREGNAVAEMQAQAA